MPVRSRSSPRPSDGWWPSLLNSCAWMQSAGERTASSCRSSRYVVRACRSWRMDYCRSSRCASGAVMLRAAVTPGRRGWSVARRALTPKHRECCASGAEHFPRRTSGGAPPSRRPPSPSPSRAAAARPRPLLRQPLSPISTGPPRQPGQLRQPPRQPPRLCQPPPRQPLRWPRCQPLGRRRSSSADPARPAPTPTVRVHLLTLTLALTLTPTLALTLTLALALALALTLTLTLTLTLALALALTLTLSLTRPRPQVCGNDPPTFLTLP